MVRLDRFSPLSYASVPCRFLVCMLILEFYNLIPSIKLKLLLRVDMK